MEKTIIEIKGVKMEVDLREATTVESYKVGQNVKVLVKSYSSYTSYPGVIVGFDAFKELPTIVIAYAEINYSEADVKFVYFNKESKDVEICPMDGEDKTINKARAIEMLEGKINKAKETVVDLIAKRDYFLKYFNMFFEAKETETKA